MACVPMCGMRHATQRIACESIDLHHVGALARRPPPPRSWGLGALGLARRSLELRGSDAAAGLPGLRLLICMEYVYTTIAR